MLLKYKTEDGKQKSIRLKTISHAKPITIGRAEEASIVLKDKECSPVHTAIRYWDDIFVIRDLNSQNGTVLNGEKIEVAKLSPGDVIEVGNTELMVVQEEGSGNDVTVVARAPEL